MLEIEGKTPHDSHPKMKRKKKSLRKQNQSTNSTFSILQLSTPHS